MVGCCLHNSYVNATYSPWKSTQKTISQSFGSYRHSCQTHIHSSCRQPYLRAPTRNPRIPIVASNRLAKRVTARVTMSGLRSLTRSPLAVSSTILGGSILQFLHTNLTFKSCRNDCYADFGPVTSMDKSRARTAGPVMMGLANSLPWESGPEPRRSQRPGSTPMQPRKSW